MFENKNRLCLFEQQKLIQTSLDGFFVVRTDDAQIIETNDAFCGIVGYAREELLTMRISDLEVNESPDETAAHIKKVMEVGHDRFDTRQRHKQGHPVDLELNVSHSEMNGGMNFVFVRDITERKRTEDVLYFIAQRSWTDSAENFFNALAQHLGEALGVDYVVIDRLDKTPDVAETVALYAKGAIVPNMHYDLKGTPCENVMGRKFCFYPQGIQQLFPDDTRLVKMGAESYAGIPLWDSVGQPIGLIAVMDGKPLRDEGSISKLLQLVAIRAAAEMERERSERVLREREHEFRTLAENMPDNIVRYNREGGMVYVNPVLERTLEDSAAAMIGTTVREYNPDGSYEDYAQLLDTVLASGEAGELEKIVPGPDGETSVHQIRVVPERGENGEIVGVLAIGRDITERKQAVKKLRESENRFRTLFESATDCMLILDMDGRIVDINRTGYERLGYQEHEMLGRKIAEFDTPKFAVLVSEQMAKIAEEGNSIFESAHVCKDGSIMPVEINTRTIQLGGESRYFSVIRDITQRKHAERQLRELTMHLQTVREEEKAHLAREIHDDLGSTLAALKMYTHWLAQKLPTGAKMLPLQNCIESMKEVLNEAMKATRRLITDLRPPELDNLGLMAALERQAEQFQKHNGIECRVACIYREANGCIDCKDCEYTLDKMLSINLFRIFQESLTNVARHSGASRVEVELQPCNHEVVLSIRDNGRGLPEGHAIASTSYGMRGMHERVEQLSGKIEFDKPLGGGLRVMVRLPQPAAHSSQIQTEE